MASTVVDSTQDPSSVYYLHPSDHTGLKFVSTPFDGTGFNDWKRSMILALTSKNKMSFIDGTLTKPTASSTNYKAWVRCNSMLIGWFISNLGTLTARSVQNLSTAREVWQDLEERFGQSSATQLYALQEEWAKLSQDGEMSIAEYFTRAKVIWDEIDSLSPFPCCECTGCSCTLTQKFPKRQQDQRLIEFLMKLHEDYSQVRSHILMMMPLPSISQAYRVLLAEQKHKDVLKVCSMPETAAFSANKRVHYDKSYKGGQTITSENTRSFNNRRDERISSDNSGNVNTTNKKPTGFYCEHCKMRGHTIDRCWKLNGYPADYKGNQGNCGKRFANLAQNENQDMTFAEESSGGLTQVQINQLLALLDKENKSENHFSQDLTTGTALLAGPFNEKASGSW